MQKINQKIEMTANILIIIVTLMLGVVIAKQFFVSSSAKANQNNSLTQAQLQNNAPLNIEGINFSEQPKTLILALQAGCHFCTESAPFYKRLIEDSRDKNVKIIAVMPNPLEESQAYFQKLGLSNLEVKEASLDNVQVSGTPTLILANDKGEVVNRWVGKLPDFKEQEVINAVFQ